MDQVDAATFQGRSADEFLLEGAYTSFIFMYAHFWNMALNNDVSSLILN